MHDNNVTIYPASDKTISYQKNIKGESKRARCEVEIIASILKLCSEGGRIKTHVMYGANLSHEMVTSYLGKLLKYELLETAHEGSKSLFTTSRKGEEYLHHYFSMQTLVEPLDD